MGWSESFARTSQAEETNAARSERWGAHGISDAKCDLRGTRESYHHFGASAAGFPLCVKRKPGCIIIAPVIRRGLEPVAPAGNGKIGKVLGFLRLLCLFAACPDGRKKAQEAQGAGDEQRRNGERRRRKTPARKPAWTEWDRKEVGGLPRRRGAAEVGTKARIGGRGIGRDSRDGSPRRRRSAALRSKAVAGAKSQAGRQAGHGGESAGRESPGTTASPGWRPAGQLPAIARGGPTATPAPSD